MCSVRPSVAERSAFKTVYFHRHNECGTRISQRYHGNRRFFPVKVSGNSEKKPWQLTQNEIDQIWAEALVYYRNNEPLILDAETERYAKNLQREAMETDEREGMVREYLETLLPDNWNESGSLV